MATVCEPVGTVVVGAGQAGLATGYHLARGDQESVILDAAGEVGASWRRRGYSLRLFTPAAFTHLPGLPFPAAPGHYPHKDALADYLAAYAERFSLPVQLNAAVESVERDGQDFVARAGRRCWRARHVVLASGAHSAPSLPTFAQDVDSDITQIHAVDYRRPSQMPSGPVLVVGAGNSGAEIALELSAEHQVMLAGRDVGAHSSPGTPDLSVVSAVGSPRRCRGQTCVCRSG